MITTDICRKTGFYEDDRFILDVYNAMNIILSSHPYLQKMIKIVNLFFFYEHNTSAIKYSYTTQH